MKTEQEQRQAIRQILFDANDICQATPCENEYCIYHGDYRCYDNIIVDKLIKAGYGDVSEYKAEIEQLNKKLAKQTRIARDANAKFTGVEHYLKPFQYKADRLQTKCDDLKKLSDWQREEIKRLKAEVNKGCDNCETIKQAQIDVLKKLRSMVSDKEALIQSYIADGCLTIEDMYTEIDELIKEVQNDK